MAFRQPKPPLVGLDGDAPGTMVVLASGYRLLLCPGHWWSAFKEDGRWVGAYPRLQAALAAVGDDDPFSLSYAVEDPGPGLAYACVGRGYVFQKGPWSWWHLLRDPSASNDPAKGGWIFIGAYVGLQPALDAYADARALELVLASREVLPANVEKAYDVARGLARGEAEVNDELEKYLEQIYHIDAKQEHEKQELSR